MASLSALHLRMRWSCIRSCWISSLLVPSVLKPHTLPRLSLIMPSIMLDFTLNQITSLTRLSPNYTFEHALIGTLNQTPIMHLIFFHQSHSKFSNTLCHQLVQCKAPHHYVLINWTVVLEIIARYKQMRKIRVAAQAHNFVSHYRKIPSKRPWNFALVGAYYGRCALTEIRNEAMKHVLL